MNQFRSGGHRVTTFLLLGTFTLSSLMPTSVRAEWLSTRTQDSSHEAAIAEPTVEQTSDNSYVVSLGNEKRSLELVSGDGSVVRVDGKLFSFDFSRSRIFNQKKLERFVSRGLSRHQEKSSHWLSSFNAFLFPQAHAMDPWVLGLGAAAIVATIVAIVYYSKSKKLEVKAGKKRINFHNNTRDDLVDKVKDHFEH